MDEEKVKGETKAAGKERKFRSRLAGFNTSERNELLLKAH
jgi:hypothetical protein